MQTVEDIFVELGGTGAVAKAISVKPSAASEMRRRGSIPVRYWPRLMEAAHLNSDTLVAIHATPAPQQAAE